jgi:hypothetical protein
LQNIQHKEGQFAAKVTEKSRPRSNSGGGMKG